MKAWTSVVVGLVLACLAAVGCTCSVGCKSRGMAEIERDASAFAALMDGKPPRGVTCMTVDSDWDGYVTCTVFRVDRDPYSIQCSTQAGGCKPTTPKIVTTGGQ